MFCLWSEQYDFVVLFVVFNLWIGPGFILDSFILFLIFLLPFSCSYPWTGFVLRYGYVS